MKVLVATEKPFAKKAVDGIRTIVEQAGYELALLEKYTDKAQLLGAVADADALIIRSDKVTPRCSMPRNSLKSWYAQAQVTTTSIWPQQRPRTWW